MKDLYEILGVTRETPKEELASKYRKLARKLHPDANGGDPELTEKFKEVSAAYEVLSDPEKRREYDMYGTVGGKPHGTARGGKHFHSVFDDFFSNMFGGGAPRQMDGDHIQVECELSLEEVLEGGKREVAFQRRDRCAKCGGSGGEELVCQHCDGKGTKIIRGPNMTVKTACHACQGTGKIIGESCGECDHGFTEPKDQKVVFNFPKGVESGMRFVFRGQGQPSANPEGKPGNLYVVTRMKPHELFERIPHGHVLLKVPVTYTQLVLGEDIDLPTLHGKVSLKIPPGTQPNSKFRLRGQGLPHFKDGNGLYRTGDQIVEVQLEVPKDLTGRYKEIIEELAQLEQGESNG